MTILANSMEGTEAISLKVLMGAFRISNGEVKGLVGEFKRDKNDSEWILGSVWGG